MRPGPGRAGRGVLLAQRRAEVVGDDLGVVALLAASAAARNASWVLSVQRLGRVPRQSPLLIGNLSVIINFGRPPTGEGPGCPAGRAIFHRHQIPPVLPVRPLDRPRRLAAGLVSSAAQAGDLGLQLQHPTHALQVEAGRGQVLDAAQLVDVPLAVAPAAADRAGRVEQPLALVDAQGLGGRRPARPRQR